VVSTLSDYLNAHLPAGWQKAQVVQALQGRMDRATVYRYMSGRHPRTPSEPVLAAFAAVLPETTVAELRAAAGLQQVGEPWVPPAEASQLNHGQRRALEAFIRATVRPTAADERPAGELAPETRAHVESFLAELHASGRPELADRLAAALVISSASDTASSSSSD